MPGKPSPGPGHTLPGWLIALLVGGFCIGVLLTFFGLVRLGEIVLGTCS